MTGPLVLERSGARAVLDPLGGRLAQLTVDRHDLLAEVDGPRTQAGCYPMVPWAGRLGQGRFTFDGTDHRIEPNMGPHAIHGVATHIEWDVTGLGSMRVSLEDHWPLGGVAAVDYVLAPESLTCTVSVTATDRAMPAVVGWHPCFVRTLSGAPDRLAFDAEFMWERGADHLPTGALVAPPPGPWDDCFGGVATTPTLTWGDEMSLRFTAATPIWVVFDELDHIICVEPQTGPPDAFNLGEAQRLAPGETLALALELAWG